MRKTGFVYDDRYMLHDTGSFHPEMPERIRAVLKGIRDTGLLAKLILITPEQADIKWVETVHNKEYIQRFKQSCVLGETQFECPDNRMCAETYEVAMLAVGGVLKAVRYMMRGAIDNAFCAVRPPGHHAEINRAMGFCYFNNVAIAARYLQIQWNIKRVGIVDFDVHHGNGTQQIFEEDPTVFYYSIHQHPSFAYPGTGREFEHGSGSGYGFTKNSPVLPGMGDGAYRDLLEKDLFPAFESFQPEVILVSAGFDAHESDDMSDIRLSTECFSWMMKRVMEMADKYSKGRVVSVLEGGYAIGMLPELVKNHVEILLHVKR
ncbi:MAG: histone deacetylase [Deltaproteobacteria bacterium]|nr:histone deacetylase [Deltaproteobacteria bacterium]MBW2152372.1 histone deacetylase [Deltaproteobacteria bacterium]